jgi:septal ring factor EnvC (AmiA/AmiB activator)
MDADTVKTLLQGVNMLGTIGLWLWLRIERRNDKTNERVAELAMQLQALNQEVTALDATAKAAPNHGDMGKVYESINSLAATVNQLVGENRGQSDTLRMILNQITQKGLPT